MLGCAAYGFGLEILSNIHVLQRLAIGSGSFGSGHRAAVLLAFLHFCGLVVVFFCSAAEQLPCASCASACLGGSGD